MVRKKTGKRKPEKIQVVDAAFERRLRHKNKALISGENKESDVEMSEQEIKAERLAQALRDNLRKRKEQARRRDEDQNDNEEPGDFPDNDDTSDD